MIYEENLVFKNEVYKEKMENDYSKMLYKIQQKKRVKLWKKAKSINRAEIIPREAPAIAYQNQIVLPVNQGAIKCFFI